MSKKEDIRRFMTDGNDGSNAQATPARRNRRIIDSDSSSDEPPPQPPTQPALRVPTNAIHAANAIEPEHEVGPANAIIVLTSSDDSDDMYVPLRRPPYPPMINGGEAHATPSRTLPTAATPRKTTPKRNTTTGRPLYHVC